MAHDESAWATYRLQLGPDLDFAAAAELTGYLAALGVTHVYCSPVLEARAGSTHGYDVVDPTRLSETLGGEEGFAGLVAAARSQGLGLVIDVVPNHLGTGRDNPLWERLLAEGASGPGAEYFDVDWAPALPGAQGKVILPVLGEPYGTVLFAGEIVVAEGGDGLRVRYHEHSMPLSPESEQALDRAGQPPKLEGTRGKPETWSRLHALLEEQHYRLVHWRAGGALVNYRRFFAIDELAAVRVEEPTVFEHTHGKVLELVDSGAVDGLRLDHIDGLTDPEAYLSRLREAVGGDTWIVVEKILGPDETLPDWPVAGTTGYDFLSDCLGLFVDASAEQVLSEIAAGFNAWPLATGLEGEVHRAKREALEQDLHADTERLVDRFWTLTQRHLEIRDVTRAQCRAALLAALVGLDVYRLYTRPGAEASEQDARRARVALAWAREAVPVVPAFLWTFLEALLTGRAGDDALHAEVLRRFHQVASAAMAKGVEDTLLYRQHRLASVNEVGVEPENLGSTVAAFHDANARRARRHPAGMLTTATHDTKRGEDVRLRIAALSEVVDDWGQAVSGWHQRHRPSPGGGKRVPDPAMEYLCYQTLVGVWPPDDAPDLEDLRARVSEYLVKAAREDGRRTSWVEPDEPYERGLAVFVDGLLADATFLEELRGIAHRTGEIAMTSSLAQVLLRTTSPGVPDTYQGQELWGDSLVDPDNRRPVDFARRRNLLADLDAGAADVSDLEKQRADGRVKLWVLSRALRARARYQKCFGPAGGYVPLRVEGRFAGHVVAYARTARDGRAGIVVAPRLVGGVLRDREGPPLGVAWEDTRVALPAELAQRRWVDALGGPGAGGAPDALSLADVLTVLPVALLVDADAAAG